jgi:CHAD domain-containing protein
MSRVSSEFSSSNFFSLIISIHATKLISHIGELRQVKAAETIHDSRVAIRSISSHLKTFSPFLRRKPTGALLQQLLWLDAKISAIRDLDVMISMVTKVENDLVKQVLITRLQSDRLAQDIKLQKTLESAKLDIFIQNLTNYALRPPVRRKFLELRAKKSEAKITAAISHTWVLLFESLENLPKQPNTKQLHRVRLATKQCRYAYEAAAESGLLQSSHIQAWTKQLQQRLGQVQDVKTLRKWIKGQSDLDALMRTQALIYFTQELPNRKQLLTGSKQTPK